MMLTAGTQLGPYEIEEPLGKGGMGEVYRAHDANLRRDVAIKLLPEELADDPERLARLKREARSLASLDHPHIATVHGFEEQDGTSFIVMELIEGETLAERLEDGALPVETALDLAVQIAKALEAAHGKGIVHRDLKPSNVKITPSGDVKILDFGIAKPLRTETEESESRLSTATVEATRTGEILGTAPYMSPEQARGKAVDETTDVWAFGCVLYEMLAGRPAFRRGSLADTIASILTTEPEPLDSSPGSVVELVEACLCKPPERRPADGGEILRALERSGSRLPEDRQRPALEQQIRFCTASDGTTLAYATTGSGAPLVKAANWLNHLEFDWESPIWRHFISALAERHLLVRYDSRGNGLSDREPEELSFDAFVDDLGTVVEATGLDRFALLGISQGCAVSIAYAVRNPGRVTHLVLHGGYAVGWRRREDIERRDALGTLMLQGWGQSNPAFRDAFTSLYIPEGTEEQRRWFSELERISASPQQARRIWDVIATIDVRPLLERVRCPTLVLHSRGDAAVPFEAGRRLAAGIPGARFVPLDSQNHLILEQEPAWPKFIGEVTSFLSG